MKYFDEKAKDWDNDPKKVERAQAFADEIAVIVKPKNTMNAMEFGSGTGLLSVELREYFNSITLVDASKGMIDVLKEKIQKAEINNFIPVFLENQENFLADGKFDIIYTMMALHHIEDLENQFQLFHKWLTTNGLVCIADLVSEDGSFHNHEPGFTGHNGFDKEELSKTLNDNGFEVINYKIFYKISKEVKGKIVDYPLFLILARKK